MAIPRVAQRKASTRALLLAWAMLSLLFLVLLATEAFGDRGSVILDDYGAMVAPAGAGAACLMARARATGQAARAWSLLGASLLCWAAGGLAWTVYEVHLGRAVPFPSLADVGYLLSVPLAVAALLSFPGARHKGAARLRPLLDGVIAAGSLLFVSWTAVLGPAYDAGTGSVLSQGIALAYPAGDVITATIALLTLARARGEQRMTMLLVAVGLLLVATADSAFAYFTAHGAYATGNLFDTGYVAGYLLIGIAAWQYRRSAEESAPSGEDLVTTSRSALILPYAPLLVSLPLAAGIQLRGEPLGLFQLAITTLVVVAILLRQLLSLQIITALSGALGSTINELRDREVELHYQAFHDPLTGLANRALFANRIDHALTRGRRPEPVILLLADLDDFKAVNDNLGHAAGDKLLATVAERLLAIMRPEDTVARLGGDEFAVLLETASGVDEARVVADRIAQAMRQPFYIAGAHSLIGVSIGIATAGDAATGEAMLRDADIAMYAAKAQGKGRSAVYATEFAVANLDRLELKSNLGDALSAGELELKYLPIVDLHSGLMIGMEALLRWNHPTRGSIPRELFIPLAEASGATLPIGRWVLSEACGQAGRWQRQAPPGAPLPRIAVNLSGRQLSDPMLIPAVRSALDAAELSADLLTIEITESLLLDDEAALSPLLELRELGVHLAIDDFGTGHSALDRLRRLPIDTLKVDGCFVQALTTGAPVVDVLITAILGIGHGLNMTVVAEGVETEDQLAALRALGCTQAQGHLFARPAEPAVITELIRRNFPLTDPVEVSTN